MSYTGFPWCNLINMHRAFTELGIKDHAWHKLDFHLIKLQTNPPHWIKYIVKCSQWPVSGHLLRSVWRFRPFYLLGHQLLSSDVLYRRCNSHRVFTMLYNMWKLCMTHTYILLLKHIEGECWQWISSYQLHVKCMKIPFQLTGSQIIIKLCPV